MFYNKSGDSRHLTINHCFGYSLAPRSEDIVVDAGSGKYGVLDY